ncbi:hypothetical protein BpHYR1_053529 [Brachionus plicatilis]|uniref:Uncharacterized protein n=1 Tax=Brachionus plicatilis TaxID=10195 RepID=A0A3M7P950_BRAPC|nr:hypothetical protein BpHYR1_053529 [Brachionus plicatilis]
MKVYQFRKANAKVNEICLGKGVKKEFKAAISVKNLKIKSFSCSFHKEQYTVSIEILVITNLPGSRFIAKDNAY